MSTKTRGSFTDVEAECARLSDEVERLTAENETLTAAVRGIESRIDDMDHDWTCGCTISPSRPCTCGRNEAVEACRRAAATPTQGPDK